MSGSKQTTTTDAKKDPWAPATPVLSDVLGKAKTYGNDPSMFAPSVSGATSQGIQKMQDMGTTPMFQTPYWQTIAQQDQAAGRTGNDTLTATANGSMLASNPYLDSVLKTSNQKIADQVNSAFSGAGRYGSNAHMYGLANAVAQNDQAARMNEYNTERGNQLNAAGILAGQGQQAGAAAGNVDAATAQQNQYLLNSGALQDQIAQATKQAPLSATQWESGLGVPIAGLGGTQNSTSTTSTPANIGGMIGGGLMAGLGAMTGNPMMVASGLGGMGSGMGGGTAMPSFGASSAASSPAASSWYKQPFFGLFGSK